MTERMAGPAIRYWEFARALCGRHQVTLAIANEPPVTLAPSGTIKLIQHNEDNIASLCERHDIIVVQGVLPWLYPAVRQTDKILVADLYDPVPLETLAQHSNMRLEEALPYQAEQVEILNVLLKYADYFLCTGERQKDLWMGALLSLGRINPFTYQDIFARILNVPFGMPDTPPQKSGPGLREDIEGFILLWGGGIWEWFDPLTIIHAVNGLRDEQPDLKLVFLGTDHPNPGIPPMPMRQKAENLAHQLGLFGEKVIFRPGWVPYEHLQNYLPDSDVGVTAHFDTPETRYAFRTRVLYYLWAGKPIITTEGDVLAEVVIKYGAGIAVPAKDVNSWILAVRKLRDPDFYADCCIAAKKLAAHYIWSSVTEPLCRVCANAQPSADIERNPLKMRRLAVRDRDAEYDRLKAQIEALFRSTSWKITAPLRWVKILWQRVTSKGKTA
jgi:glycosyltransferase involved in cell wall biosynthesis